MKLTKPCPQCASELVVRVNRNTEHEFLGCSQWPECTHTEPMPEYIRLKRMGAAELPGFEEES